MPRGPKELTLTRLLLRTGCPVSSSFSRTQAVRDGLTRLAEVIGSNPASIAFLRMMQITGQLSRTFAHKPGSDCKQLDQKPNSKAMGGRQSPSGSALQTPLCGEWSTWREVNNMGPHG